jgi:hypothetical protein
MTSIISHLHFEDSTATVEQKMHFFKPVNDCHSRDQDSHCRAEAASAYQLLGRSRIQSGEHQQPDSE